MIRVVTVDDSSLSRMILTKVLEADGDIKIVGTASNGFEAVPRIQEHKPDLVTMDIDMPGPNGLETIERIMHTCPVPILVVTGERLGPETDLGFRAIQLGALDFMAKPSIADEGSMVRLRAQVRALAGTPVFLHTEDRDPVSKAVRTSVPDAPPFSIVAIASGTGGPKSVATILKSLPANFGAPIVIVQQMPEKFNSAFAKYLQSLTELRVMMVEAMPHDCFPGEVLLSGSDAHIYFPRRGVAVGMHSDPYAGQRPSATVLMRSIAETYGADSVGILLSGSGDDGIEGLAAMKSTGALTLAESPSSAVIAEAPAAAMKKGAAERALPAQMIANCLVSAMAAMNSKTTAPPSHDASLQALIEDFSPRLGRS
jgi:two-component system, chemotaxis family, protein-glutamate methylesterase/glutaminase